MYQRLRKKFKKLILIALLGRLQELIANEDVSTQLLWGEDFKFDEVAQPYPIDAETSEPSGNNYESTKEGATD